MARWSVVSGLGVGEAKPSSVGVRVVAVNDVEARRALRVGLAGLDRVLEGWRGIFCE